MNDLPNRLQSDVPQIPGDSPFHVSSSTAQNISLPKRKAPRKGHTKSRTGCLNCKRARIKCKENKPACDYCAHRDLRCVWPDLSEKRPQQKEYSTSVLESQVTRWQSESSPDTALTPASSNGHLFSLQHTSPVFSMKDFRLFHFFMERAYPHHPLGNDKVWRHEIPCLASDHDFLLHSMLALSASELASTTDPTIDMHSTALTHRVKAISSLNAAVARGIQGFEEGNAMLAACFSLLFQSCLLEDGLSEYMMFIRGTVSIGYSMGAQRMRFIFEKIFDQEQLEQIDPEMHQAPLIDPRFVASACRSFENFKHLCQHKVEIDVYVVLSGIASSLITSSRDAYLGLRKMYELFSWSMTQPDFEHYCNPTILACQLLQAHFTALQLVMAPVTKPEQRFKEAQVGKEPDDSGKTVEWLVGIHRRVPAEYKQYFLWTKWVEEQVLKGYICNGKICDVEEPAALKCESMGTWKTDWGHVTNAQV